MFAATCLWLGPGAIFAYSLYAALLGGALTLLLMFWRNLPLPLMLTSQGWLVRLHSPKEGGAVRYRAGGSRAARLPQYPVHGRARRLTIS